MRRTNRLLVALGAFAAVVLSTTVTAAPAWSHGYASSPPSRSANCANGTVSNCGAIQWEPQSVEGLKGFPGAGPADGQICAGGISHFSQLDDPRGGSWPATTVTAGQRTFTWTLTAAHATDKWEYYITKDGWNPNQPLRRADLDLVPIYAKHDGGARPNFTVSHNVTLPSKSGRHLVLAVWTIADTANAFYSCIDVTFGGGGNPGNPGPGPGTCTTPAWNASTAYTGGSVVTHGGAEYRAKWWTQGEEPGTTGEWGVWAYVRAC
jgi:chitin-binding protein